MFLIVGCASIGPSRVQIDRGAYNNIVQETEQQQYLMNIVRARYLEVSQYIQIGSLTASYSLNESMAANVSATTGTGPASVVSSLSPTIGYADTPTISYTPLSSAEFARSLIKPVSMNDFILLAHAGKHDNMTLFSLLMEEVGDLNSDLLHVRGIDHITPKYIKYKQMVHLFRKLFRDGAFAAPVPITFERQLGGVFTFEKHAKNTPDALKFKKLLGIAAESNEVIFLNHPLLNALEEENGYLVNKHATPKYKNTVYVRLRSLHAMIFILARGVQIPCKDISAHKTKELVYPDGSRYDWTNEMRGIFTVYHSNKEPMHDVLVKVFHHKHWFYIKSTDLASKDTFFAAIRLHTLTSATADTSKNAPLLTIPVGANIP